MTAIITDDDLQKLKERSQNFHDGKELLFLKRILLPFHSFKLSVLARKRTGPEELDDIFFNLIQNKINTREQIAKRLGVDEDEFIFNHLDALIHAGYVSIEKENTYNITEQGRHFISGEFKEERFEKISFEFIWGNMMNRIETDVTIIENSKEDQYSRTHDKIKHSELPVNDALLTPLAKHFNKVKYKDGIVFYDIDISKRIKYLRNYAEYVALFYTSQSGGDNLRIDLRVRDKDDSSQFSPCEELSEKIKNEEYWYKKFKGIHEKEILAREKLI